MFMAEKKDPSKFTIGFNRQDPQHRIVIDLINQQGRRKAQFIVNAVLHYIHCTETPDIPQPVPVDSKMIEEIVLRILQQRTAADPMPEPKQTPAKRPTKSESVHMDEMEDLLGKDGMSTIVNTLAAFRRD